MDLFKDIPRTPAENVAYRMFLREAAAKDAVVRADILAACKEDVFFWLEAFAWLYEPRLFEDNGVPRPRVIPFLVWDHQRPVIADIKKHIGYRDIGIEKSRGEGMSWIGLMLALHQWLFETEPVNIGMVSSTEKKADTPGNMDSLMAKLDWELLQLPVWMAGQLGVDYIRNKNEHTLNNTRNSSQIVAFAAASGGPRGGRYTWFMMDELSSWDRGPDDAVMASAQQATKSRLVISTPLGSDGAYYKFMHTQSNALKLTLDWKMNPSRNQGLYRYEEGKIVAVDPINNPLLPGYDPISPEVADMFSDLRKRGFVIENRIRSPWYDQECYRADSNPVNIAQELDRDYGGSVERFFGETVEGVVANTTQTPALVGEFYVDSELNITWDAKRNGHASLWMQLDARGKPPKAPYGVGVDAAMGNGGEYSSNSVVSAINMKTGEQVLEYVTNEMAPKDLADLVVGLCRWLYGAYLCWEHMGPGTTFGLRVLQEHMYLHSYKRDVLTSAGKVKAKEYGFINRGEWRAAMFEETRDLLLKQSLLIRSGALGAELPQYVRLPGNKIFHVHERGVFDPSHGDRVIAFGMAALTFKDMAHQYKPNENAEGPDETIPGTLAYREWVFNQRNVDEANGWDDRSTSDFRGASREHAYY